MKEIIFLVTWVAINIVPVPCPSGLKKDQYGLGSSFSSCAVFHFREDSTEMQKEFILEKEADEFIAKMPASIFGQRCEKIIKTKIIKEKK